MRKNYKPLWSQPSKYVAPQQQSPLLRRQAQFDALNHHVTAEGGWVTSIRGSSTFRFEVPRGSKLPAKLTLSGYELQAVDSRMRLAPDVINEQLSLLSSGSGFEATAGSTKPVALNITHAGEVRVDAYEITRGIA